jgi:predicted glycoside hydrolase/deacetylase ChbG (UPF0249 family)
MRALIVNADDLAYSPEVTAGICEAHAHGVVTDASALVRSPHARTSISQAQAVGLAVGLHLDLVSPFVADRSACCGPQGKFCRELFAREFKQTIGPGLTAADLIGIRDEIRSQIEDFAALAGRLPSHLDYHYGWHYLSELMAIYLLVAEQYAIPARWGATYAGRNPYRLAPVDLRDRFTCREDAGVESFLAVVDEPWEGVLEIVCHPGYTTPGGLPDPYNGGRERELRALTDPRLKAGLEERGIELVTFDWLKAQLNR